VPNQHDRRIAEMLTHCIEIRSVIRNPNPG
jgi:hypothetical protein